MKYCLAHKRFILSVATIVFVLSNVFSQDNTINYYDQSLYDLSNIYITSENKTKQKLSNTSTTIRIISSDQIKTNGYYTLEEALADLPGFQFRNILGLNSYSFLRGLPRQNNAILILIDGIQINELNSGGFYGGGQYNLANVERIEVIYGPASVIYGTNAISGVINIITKDPDGKNELSAQTAVGSFNSYLADLTYSYSGEKMSLQLSAMFKTSEKADLSGDNNDNYWDENLEIFETDYAFDAKLKRGAFTAGINYQNRQSSTSTHYPSVNTEHMGYGTFWNLLLVNSYIKHHTELSDKLSVQTTLYHRNTTILGNTVKLVTIDGQTAYYRPNNLTGLESVFNFKPSENLNIVAGILGKHERLAAGYSKTFSNEFFITPPKPIAPDMTGNLLIGSFLQFDYRFLKYWQITAGARLEYSTSYEEVLTPRVSLLFNKGNLSTKFIYGQAYRAPKPWDFSDGLGNPNLRPENFNSFELAGAYFFSTNFKAEVSIYKNTLYAGLAKVFTPLGDNYYWDNTGDLSTDGTELSFSYAKNNIRLFGNYTYNYSTDISKKLIAEIATHTGVLGFNYTFLNYFNGGLRAYYLGKRKNPKIIQATGSEFIDPALVINATLSVLNYKNTDIQLIIKNLTNTEYYHTSNLTPDRFRQPQLSFLLKMSYNLKNLR